MVRRWFPTGWVLMSVDVTISPRKINEADLPSEVRWWPRWSAVLGSKQLAQSTWRVCKIEKLYVQIIQNQINIIFDFKVTARKRAVSVQCLKWFAQPFNVFAESALSNLLCICSSAHSTGPAIHFAVASPLSFDVTQKMLRKHTSLATKTHVSNYVQYIPTLAGSNTYFFHRHQPRQTT